MKNCFFFCFFISSFVTVYSHFIEINLSYKQILYINVKILAYSKSMVDYVCFIADKPSTFIKCFGCSFLYTFKIQSIFLLIFYEFHLDNVSIFLSLSELASITINY